MNASQGPTLTCTPNSIAAARVRRLLTWRLAGLLVGALALFPALRAPGLIGQAWAQGGHANHGGGSIGEILEGGCQQMLGEHFKVSLSAYPAENFNYQSMCDHVPLGDTFLTVDITDPELRKLPVGLQIVQITADQTPERLIHEVPPAAHPTGSLEAHLTFPASGEYAVIVTAANSHTMSARFPLHVGGASSIGLWLGIMAALAVVAGGAYWFKTRRTA